MGRKEERNKQIHAEQTINNAYTRAMLIDCYTLQRHILKIFSKNFHLHILDEVFCVLLSRHAAPARLKSFSDASQDPAQIIRDMSIHQTCR